MNATLAAPHHAHRGSFFHGILSLFSAARTPAATVHKPALHTPIARPAQAKTPLAQVAQPAQPVSGPYRYGPPRSLYGAKAFTPVQAPADEPVARAKPVEEKYPALRPIFGSKGLEPRLEASDYGPLRPIFGTPESRAHRAKAAALAAESNFSEWVSFEDAQEPEAAPAPFQMPPTPVRQPSSYAR
ncbi:MAG: hypothetical protein SFU83_22285 [Meiothermus sp.]|nr:hypothetical protein [Meiothermus sp.]